MILTPMAASVYIGVRSVKVCIVLRHVRFTYSNNYPKNLHGSEKAVSGRGKDIVINWSFGFARKSAKAGQVTKTRWVVSRAAQSGCERQNGDRAERRRYAGTRARQR